MNDNEPLNLGNAQGLLRHLERQAGTGASVVESKPHIPRAHCPPHFNPLHPSRPSGERGHWALDNVEMSAHSYIEMALGIVFSLALGVGSLGLMFYSSRHGYDDRP